MFSVSGSPTLGRLADGRLPGVVPGAPGRRVACFRVLRPGAVPPRPPFSPPHPAPPAPPRTPPDLPVARPAVSASTPPGPSPIRPTRSTGGATPGGPPSTGGAAPGCTPRIRTTRNARRLSRSQGRPSVLQSHERTPGPTREVPFPGPARPRAPLTVGPIPGAGETVGL